MIKLVFFVAIGKRKKRYTPLYPTIIEEYLLLRMPM